MYIIYWEFAGNLYSLWKRWCLNLKICIQSWKIQMPASFAIFYEEVCHFLFVKCENHIFLWYTDTSQFVDACQTVSVPFTSSLHYNLELFQLSEGSRHICLQSVCRYFCAVLYLCDYERSSFFIISELAAFCCAAANRSVIPPVTLPLKLCLAMYALHLNLTKKWQHCNLSILQVLLCSLLYSLLRVCIHVEN